MSVFECIVCGFLLTVSIQFGIIICILAQNTDWLNKRWKK